MTDVPEQLQEAAADAAAVVSEQAESMEHFIRSLQRVKVTYGLVGYAIGAATGALIAWKLAYHKAERKFAEIADAEVAEMSEHYHAKVRSLEANREKGDLEDLVQERGYTPEEDDERPPMAVTPPDAVVEAASTGLSEETTRVPPPVPTEPARRVERRNLFRDAGPDTVLMDSWDYDVEKRHRSPEFPYVIHYDERNEFEEYGEETLTYYERDDVLCNERDEVIGEGDERNELIGEKHLDQFGHGSNDPSIVYVRNDRVEMVYEIVKTPNSFSEEVHGFTHDSYSNLEKMRIREREALDDDG